MIQKTNPTIEFNFMKYKPCKYCGRYVASGCDKCPKCGGVNPYGHGLPIAFIFICLFIFFLLVFIGYDLIL